MEAVRLNLRLYRVCTPKRTSMWHFAVLTRTDGKTGAVLLIVYEWLWMLEKKCH